MKAIEDIFRRFHPVSGAALETLRALLSPFEAPRRHRLQDFGAVCRTIYALESGAARIFYVHDGKDVTEQFAFEGSLLFRAESLFTGRPSRKAIEILEPSRLVGLDADGLFRAFDAQPELERWFRHVVEGAWVDSIRRLEAIQFQGAEERYRRLMEEYPDHHRLPLKHVASYLGITPVSLSRIRAQRR